MIALGNDSVRFPLQFYPTFCTGAPWDHATDNATRSWKRARIARIWHCCSPAWSCDTCCWDSSPLRIVSQWAIASPFWLRKWTCTRSDNCISLAYPPYNFARPAEMVERKFGLHMRDSDIIA